MERITYHENVASDFVSYTGGSSRMAEGTLVREAGKRDAQRNAQKNAGISADVTNYLLRSIPAHLLDVLRPSLRNVYLAKEQYLFQQDDELDYVYFPETAVISEFHMLEDGRVVEVSITGREGAIGISTLFCSSRVANYVQASQAGTALRIESCILKKLARQHPELGFLLSPYLDKYIRQISQKAVCNMYHSVEERFCTWLLMLQDRCEKRTLKLTHEQIARTLGVYRPSVTCIAIDMKKKKMIDYSRGGIFIRDRARLEQTACDCYFELGKPVEV